MGRDGKQRERTRSESSDARDRDDDYGGDTGNRSGRGSQKRMHVSDRTSWSGLAKRAYNVVTGDSRRRDDGSSVKLVGSMLLGAFLTGLLPLPLTWLVGVGLGAAVAGRYGEGSASVAAGTGAVVGFVGGLAFATALFGLGFLFTLLLTVIAAVLGGIGFLLGGSR
jgi:hypothetical protein